MWNQTKAKRYSSPVLNLDFYFFSQFIVKCAFNYQFTERVQYCANFFRKFVTRPQKSCSSLLACRVNQTVVHTDHRAVERK